MPEEYYMENGNGDDDTEATTVLIKKGDSHKVDFIVDSPESFIK